MPDNEIETRARQEASHLFSSAGAAIQGLRLRVDSRVVVSLEDLYAAFQEARRKYEDRKYREAYDKYDQVYGLFGDRIGQWDRKAEANFQAVKDRHKPGRLEQLKTEMADVKTQSQSAYRLLSRLRSALEPLSKLEDAIGTGPAATGATEKSKKSKTVRRARVVDESLLDFPEDEGMPPRPAAGAGPPRASRQGPGPAPRGFLEAFKAADAGRRPAIIKRYFDVECEPTVEIVPTAQRRMSVRFDPPLETGRFWFLLDAARIVRIEGVGEVLEIYDPEQDQRESISLKDFVGHVQQGAWLLRPKPGERP